MPQQQVPVDLPKTGAPVAAAKMFGRFKITGVLGKGSMGKVFQAEDMTLRRNIALKVLPQQMEMNSRTYRVEQFIREARAAAILDHPNIVQVYDIGQINGFHFIAMELVDGGNLFTLVKGSGPLDPLRACQLCAEAAEALAFAHQAGVIHRDVKPENLMLTRGGRCKVADFGLARLEDATDPFKLKSEAVGTPHYIAPEITQGQPATAKSDAYSLAGTLFFLLTGRPPYMGETQQELLQKHAHAPVPDPRTLRPDLPESLGAAIQKGLAKDPSQRFDVVQFAKVLRFHTIPVGTGSAMALAGMGSGSSGAIPGSIQRRRFIWGLIGGIAAAVISIAILIYVIGYMSTPPQSALAGSPAPAESMPVVADVLHKPAPLPAGTPTPYQTSDNLALIDAAKRGEFVVLTGKVSKMDVRKKKGAIIKFHHSVVECVYDPSIYGAMETKFGGKGGELLLDKTVKVRGLLELEDGSPQLRIDKADQVEIDKP